ncbi:MAG: gamma-glutamyl-gamma-aminobutyrate hydrolase family protein, partial [Thermodesulfobacteriota bacterium]
YDREKYPFIDGEIELIKNALARDIPTLGICLGAQLMAAAAGARVYKGAKKEIGWYDISLTIEGVTDPLFNALPEKMKVFQWHGDTFDIPDDAVCLASSELFPRQMLRIGKNGYALQFHLEVTQSLIEDFVSAGSAELSELKGEIDPKRIILDTPAYIDYLHSFGNLFFSRFFDLLDS